MSPVLIILLVLLGLVAAVLVWMAGTYNRLITLLNRFKNAYAQIDVQLKRRHDLIPNLVETAKGYMAHERQTLEAVVAARNLAIAASSKAMETPTDIAAIQAVAGAEGALGGLLKQFIGLAEAYPDLKANTNMGQLMEELSSTENRIAFARQAYNDAVMHYNTAIQQFPAALIAGGFRFTPAQLFQIETAAEREVVKVTL